MTWGFLVLIWALSEWGFSVGVVSLDMEPKGGSAVGDYSGA